MPQLLSSGSDGLIKLWNAKNHECDCTLDAHEDKVWALDVVETDDGVEVWSGSADSVMVRWRDSTRAEQQQVVERSSSSFSVNLLRWLESCRATIDPMWIIGPSFPSGSPVAPMNIVATTFAHSARPLAQHTQQPGHTRHRSR